MGELLQQLVNGISLGAIYALTALGSSGGSLALGSLDNNYWGGSSNGAPTSCDAIVQSGLGFYPDPSDFSCNSFASNLTCGDPIYTLAKPTGLLHASVVQVDTCSLLRRWDGITTTTKQEALEQYDTLRMYIDAPQDPFIDHLRHKNESNQAMSSFSLNCDELTNARAGRKGWSPSSFARSVPSPRSEDSDDSLYLYNTAKTLYLVDPVHALDTMRMYVELHPYATHLPGKVFSALNYTVGITNRLPNVRLSNWINNYNWLVVQQPRNSEAAFQAGAVLALASTLEHIDLNEAANMYYNYALMFPDSADVAEAWRGIRDIRNYQSLIPEDTTPFHKLTFPVQQKQGGAIVTGGEIKAITYDLAIASNPAIDGTDISFTLPIRSECHLGVYDVLGKEEISMLDGYRERGSHTVHLQTRGLSTGTYYVRLEYPGGVTSESLKVVG
jgi:hypothetical protein